MAKIITYFLNLILGAARRFSQVVPEAQNWYNADENKYKKTLTVPPRAPDRPRFRGVAHHSPVAGNVPYVTSPYGYRVLNIQGKSSQRVFHYGLDLRAVPGSPAFAVEDCTITEIVRINPKAPCRFRWDQRLGKWVDLNNGAITPRIVIQGLHTGNIYKMKHCEPDKNLRPGMKLECGIKIGEYGDYGYCMGSHCHFEVWMNKDKSFGSVQATENGRVLVDPQAWLEKYAGIKCTGKTRQTQTTLTGDTHNEPGK